MRLAAGSDVIIEEEILHFPAAITRPLDARAATGAPVGSGASLTLTVEGGGAPVAGARVVLVLRSGSFVVDTHATTDSRGEVRFVFSPIFRPAVVVVTPPNFWATVFRSPADGEVLVVPSLPKGPTYWWHAALGREDGAGGGIRCGVIDTGVGPHRDLRHVTNVGAFIDGGFDPTEEAGRDVDVHGTHVNGTIGARPTKTSRRPIGLAGEVDLFSARVFPPGAGANQGDIANAIDHLSRTRGVDLINMSLGAPVGSAIEQDAIRDALERGTLCICAAGNSSRPVEFPAAFPETVAVAALGLEGWGPPGTLASAPPPGRSGSVRRRRALPGQLQLLRRRDRRRRARRRDHRPLPGHRHGPGTRRHPRRHLDGEPRRAGHAGGDPEPERGLPGTAPQTHARSEGAPTPRRFRARHRSRPPVPGRRGAV